MFGNNKDYISQAQLDELLQPLVERIDQLETSAKKQAELIAVLERQLKDLHKKNEEPRQAEQAHVGIASTVAVQPSALQTPVSETLFLSAPTADATFTEQSSTEQVGKSIYQLRTEDGVNGHFVMLSTPDAIATAMISVSQFVKPVCRIEGNIHRLPQHIETLEEGIVQRDGTVWRVVQKATILFE